MKIRRVWALPSAFTFSIRPIKELIERYIRPEMVIIDPFANKSQYGTITNDLNPEYGTTYCMDALTFLRKMKTRSADIVLYDPPYSFRQATECYKGFGKDKLEIGVTNMKYWSECKKEIARIVKVGGAVICCGWNSNGLDRQRGFDIVEVLIVRHGGSRHDTIVTVEINANLF